VFDLECTGSDTQLYKFWRAIYNLYTEIAPEIYNLQFTLDIAPEIALDIAPEIYNLLSRQWFWPRHNKNLFYLS